MRRLNTDTRLLLDYLGLHPALLFPQLVDRDLVALVIVREHQPEHEQHHQQCADGATPFAPTQIDIERVITETLENTPRDATQWSTRTMRHQFHHGQSDLEGICVAAASV